MNHMAMKEMYILAGFVYEGGEPILFMGRCHNGRSKMIYDLKPETGVMRLGTLL
jgi:hypothetical protein